jgi:hypothetical protein
LATLAVLPGATPAGAVTTTNEGVPAFSGPVFMIIGENTQLSQLNAGNAPYLLGTLKPASAWLTDYWATTHYSESNYAAMTSGQFITCQQKDVKVTSCHQDVPNLFAQLGGAGTSFTTWSESMPAPCYLLNTGGDPTLNHYAAKHNPQLFFDNVEGDSLGGTFVNNTATTQGGTYCQSNNIATGGTGPNDTSIFDSALASNASTISAFNLVVPNECEDGHSNCKPRGNPILQFDDFLAREVPLIQSYINAHGGLLIVTFDEGVTSSPKRAVKFGNGGNVAFAVWGPQVHAATYTDGPYTHYSLLRTLEDGLLASPSYVGHAADVGPIAQIWNP